MSRLGELFIKRKLLTPDQLLESVEAHRKDPSKTLAEVFVTLGFMDEHAMIRQLEEEFHLPTVDPAELRPKDEELALVSFRLAHKHLILPVKLEGTTLTIATTDPSNHPAFNELRFSTNFHLRIVLAPAVALRKAIDRAYDHTAQAYSEALNQLEVTDFGDKHAADEVNVGELARQTEDAPIVKLVNTLLADAVFKRASDIHIEPYESDLRVRFRIDGVLHDVMQPKKQYKDALASRIKILAQLDIAQRRLPQDGTMKVRIPNGPKVNFRVSVLPMVFGEKVVMRLLRDDNVQADMAKLGLEPEQLEIMREAINRPYGMMLVTGPTGSGKSTTLYSALTELNDSSRNISTAEDPVEYYVRGINQVHVLESVGLTFASVLRAFLRQDPDVIMVGEIRDQETAEIAIKAALTGHFVFSTLHTNDAPSSISRIMNMGVEPFLIASSLTLVIAQRLCRVICPHCKEPFEGYSAETLREVGFNEEEARSIVLYKGKGCDECSDTGYHGRLALYEMLRVNEGIRQAVIARVSTDVLRQRAIDDGLQSLRQSGLNRVRDGLTTVEEVLRVTALD